MFDPEVPVRAPKRRGWRPTRVEVALGLAAMPLFAWIGLTRMADERGLARIDDGQVAVLVDHARATTRVSSAPGLRPFAPWFQDVFALDERPIEFRFEGNEKGTSNRFARRLVRDELGYFACIDRLATIEFNIQPLVQPQASGEAVAPHPQRPPCAR